MPASIQGQNGSGDLMRAARSVVWGFAVDAGTAVSILAGEWNARCQPPWAEHDLRRACERATSDGNNPRGWLLAEPSPTHASGATRRAIDPALMDIANAGFDEPTFINSPTSPPPPPPPPPPGGPGGSGSSGEPPSPPLEHGVDEDDPARLAALFLRRYTHADGTITLRYWNDQWYEWACGRYSPVTDGRMMNRVVAFCEAHFTATHAARLRSFGERLAEGQGRAADMPRKKKASGQVLSDTIKHLRSQADLDLPAEPRWINAPNHDPVDTIAFPNGVLDLREFANGRPEAFTPATPLFFTQVGREFTFDPQAPQPVQWLSFLSSVFGGDRGAINLLQEWFGYLLTTDISLHRMLMIVGPPRAGKGTIREIIARLVGVNNVIAPTLGELAETFGLEPLIGKTVAMIADARLSGRPDREAISERLLSITGGDPQTINRKNRQKITVNLSARFVLFSNEVPRLPDSSGAIMTRLCMIGLNRSFVGREDRGLLARLLTELPSIFIWAIEGWRRLRRQGRFTDPESAVDLIDQARAMASPIHTFVEERCTLDKDAFTVTQDLFNAWVDWCNRGNRHVGDIAVFARNLKAAFPVLQRGKPQRGEFGRQQGYHGVRLLPDPAIFNSV